MRLFVKFSILWILLPFAVIAQSKKGISHIDSLKNVFVQLYNQGNSDAIYNMCDTGFQRYLRSYGFTRWFSETRQNLGECVQTVKTKQSGETAIYKAYFQRDSLDLILGVDRSGKMTTLILRPLPVPQKKYTVQSDNLLKNATDSIVEKVMDPYIQQENTVGVSVGIVDEGRFYTYDYGETEKDGHQLPTENTIYEIGSITKTFTSALLAEMVLQGKCKLGDPVNKYLPANIPMLQKHDTIVTLKMLANHTSGLPRIPSDLFSRKTFVEGDPYKNYDTADLFNYLDTVRLRTTPGIRFSYSNLGFGLLGTILERISGLTYQQLMEKYICNPLKMNDTRTILNEGQQKYFSQGYNERGKPVSHWHFASLAGCGAIRSSVHDMLKYLNAHLTEDDPTNLLKAFQLCEQPTFSIEGRQIGLGWIIPERSPGWYWHNGGTGGFRSYCAINPDKKIAFVILANSAIGVDNEGVELRKALSR